MSSRCIKESLAGDHHDDESSVRLCLLLTTMLMSMVIYMYIYSDYDDDDVKMKF